MSDLSHDPRAGKVKAHCITPAGVRATLFVALLLLIVCLLGFGGYGRLAVAFYQPASPSVLSGKTQTQCVGRYLIDTPVELGRFSFVSTQFQYGVQSYAPTVQLMLFSWPTASGFADYVAERTQVLQERRVESIKPSALLAHEVWDTPHGKAHLLRHLSAPEPSPYWPITSELHMLVGGHHVMASGTSYASAQDDPPAVHATYPYIDPRPMEARLRAIAQHIKAYDDVSTAPAGFCLEGVLMDNKTMGYAVERSLFVLVPPDNAQSHRALAIQMQGHLQANEAAFTERIARENSQQRLQDFWEGENQQIVELRRGPRDLGAIPGLEYAEGRHGRDGVHFLTQWQSQWSPAQQSLQRPAIDMWLQLGTRDNPAAMDKDQTLMLWDHLLGSLRLSPANGG